MRSHCWHIYTYLYTKCRNELKAHIAITIWNVPPSFICNAYPYIHMPNSFTVNELDDEQFYIMHTICRATTTFILQHQFLYDETNHIKGSTLFYSTACIFQHFHYFLFNFFTLFFDYLRIWPCVKWNCNYLFIKSPTLKSALVRL